VFERYREADVAVEECEQQLQDLNMLSLRTQRPLKLLIKPHDFSGGIYCSETDAADNATAGATETAAVKVVSVTALAHPMLRTVVLLVHICIFWWLL
jgi:hypothetical protein